MDYLKRECERAQESPAYENTFKRLHLNIRTEQAVRWFAMEKWDACAGVLEEKSLLGCPCWAGLDLSTTTDIAAFAALFPDEETGVYKAVCRFWVPKENAIKRERRDRVPYTQWMREGWIKATEGNVIDYDVIRADIKALGEQYNIREIAIDRWNATQLSTQLAGDGFEMITFGQGFASMSAPAKAFEALVLGGKLEHGGNPVLRWMASNVAVEIDAAANVKPSKKKSTERIDGIVACIMALGRAAVRTEKRRSIYETEEPFVI